jgi:hypothetical protein
LVEKRDPSCLVYYGNENDKKFSRLMHDLVTNNVVRNISDNPFDGSGLEHLVMKPSNTKSCIVTKLCINLLNFLSFSFS